MPEIGETIKVSEFVFRDDHNEKTCPWHSKKKPGSQTITAQQGDDDGPIPKNLGGELAKNLRADGQNEPKVDSLDIPYEPGRTIHFMKGGEKKKVRTYAELEEDWVYEYPLQYAPHHLIPGNESLKGSSVVPFMGDNATIKLYKKKGQSSETEKGSIGYNVNSSKNGVWLPSPYALSMSNEWPSADGIKVLKARNHKLLGTTETFGMAYAVESMSRKVSGGRQFHMRHKDYSTKVQEILDTIGGKLVVMKGGACKLAKPKRGKKKCKLPMGLVGRLDVLSNNLKGFLTLKVWRAPLYADGTLTKVYAEEIKKKRQRGKESKAKGKVTKVL